MRLRRGVRKEMTLSTDAKRDMRLKRDCLRERERER